MKTFLTVRSFLDSDIFYLASNESEDFHAQTREVVQWRKMLMRNDDEDFTVSVDGEEMSYFSAVVRLALGEIHTIDFEYMTLGGRIIKGYITTLG